MVITSAITPASEVGSTPSALEASAVLAAPVVYNLTLAALSVVIVNNIYDLNPVISKSASAASAKLPVVPVAVLLLDSPPENADPFTFSVPVTLTPSDSVSNFLTLS